MNGGDRREPIFKDEDARARRMLAEALQRRRWGRQELEQRGKPGSRRSLRFMTWYFESPKPRFSPPADVQPFRYRLRQKMLCCFELTLLLTTGKQWRCLWLLQEDPCVTTFSSGVQPVLSEVVANGLNRTAGYGDSNARRTICCSCFLLMP